MRWRLGADRAPAAQRGDLLNVGRTQEAVILFRHQKNGFEIGREAARKGLSVREVERRVALALAPRGTSSATRKDANTRAAEEKLKALSPYDAAEARKLPF